MSDTVVLERRAGVLLITLNRPQAKNALDAATTDALTAALRAARDDETVRAVVLTGAGGDFCAGGDVKGMGQGGARTPEQRRAGMGATATSQRPWPDWTSR